MAAGAVAAHVSVLVKVDGTPVSMPAEACQQITGKYYRVTNATKRCIDPRVALEVRDNGVAVVAANIEHIDYLQGIVKFASGYTVTGPVTIQAGSYIPFSTLAYVKSFNASGSAEMVDKTVFGNLVKRYLRGLGDFKGEVGEFSHLEDAAGVETLEVSLNSGTRRVISVEIIQDGSVLANGGLVFRGLVYLASTDTSGEAASIVESGLSFEGAPLMSTLGVSGSWPVTWSLLDGGTGIFI